MKIKYISNFGHPNLLNFAHTHTHTNDDLSQERGGGGSKIIKFHITIYRRDFESSDTIVYLGFIIHCTSHALNTL